MIRKLLKCFFVVVTLIAFTISLDSSVTASNYGEGSYGSGEYGVGEVTVTPVPTSTSSSSAGAPVCNDTKPGSAPWLYGASTKGSDSILLQFTESLDPVNEYVLEYGTESGKYQFAMANIGGKGTTSYLVQSLFPNTTYYFRVRAGNGCATGDWSNGISATTKGTISFNQLEVVETELKPEPQQVEKPKEESACKSHTVVSGDSLWSIADELLGDGNRYKEIVEENKDQYPTLSTSSALISGWELKVNCPKSESQTGISDDEESYEVNVKVLNTKEQPIEGAKVTLHSDPKEAVTDQEGVAKFTDVEEGEHKLLISYKNYEGEQSIFLTGDDATKVFNINIVIEPKNVLLSKEVLTVVGILVSAILILLFLLFRKRRNN